MLLDARDLKTGAVLSADVCIAGSGPAGITLATELVDSGLDVVLLESGGFSFDDDAQALNEGHMTGIQTWSPRDMRLRLFGGTSGHWGGFCRPLSREDFERRDWVTGSGWPIVYDTLEPYYVRAQQTCQAGALDYDAKRMSERIGVALLTDDESVLEHNFYRLSPPTRFGTRYRKALEDAENVRTYTYATLLDIRLDQKLSAVERFDCSTLEGKRFSVEAGRFVLALGALENARVLLASAGQIADGVANSSGMVGRRFMEHPHYYDSVAMVLRSDANLGFFRVHDVDPLEEDGEDGFSVLGTLGLRAEVRAAEGLLNMSVSLGARDIEDQKTGMIAPSNVAALLGQRTKDTVFVRCTCRTEQTPYEESRLTLGYERDELGMRRFDLDWRVREDDERALRRALEIIGSELGRLGLGRLWMPHKGGRFAWKQSPGGHHMGTTFMGDDPKKSVVDAELRCHDTENLYVAGSSVFATVGDANPTLTIVALAHRLADHLTSTTPALRGGAAMRGAK
jgi:choline dehydrogenase-like flavoprotein